MTIYPVAFHLGPLTITGYGLMMMVAFLMAGWAIQVDLRRRRMNEDYAADIVFAAVLGGIIGAKVWYVLLTGHWDALFQRGGFVWYGGFLGGVAGVLLTGWWKGVPARWTMEVTAAPLALGYAIGRVGCFLVNDDYGIPSTLPWAMKFPQGLPPTTVADLTALHVHFPPGTDPLQVVAVHPTQIYETALMLLAFAWLWRLRDHAHGVGWPFGAYVRRLPRARGRREAADRDGAREGRSPARVGHGGAGDERAARVRGGAGAHAPARAAARPGRRARRAYGNEGRRRSCPAPLKRSRCSHTTATSSRTTRRSWSDRDCTVG